MRESSLSRRSFLGGSLALAAGALCPALLRGEAPGAQGVVRDGGLVRLPGRGDLYIASDFHTRHTDFQKWLARTEIAQKLKDREDVYALILGDAVDAKPGDAQAEKDGDSRIIDRIRQLQTDLGPAGKRLIFIRGNHEHAVSVIYEALKKRFGLTPANRMQLVGRLYQSVDGDFYRQFNFLERINDEQHEYIKTLPVAVVGENGFVATHAGPSRTAAGPRDLIAMTPKVVEELVWSRPAEIQEGGYAVKDLIAFLDMLGKAGVLVVGHTPLGGLPPSWLRNGVGMYGGRQIILATSYGSEPGEKSHLLLNLAKRYNSNDDFAVGREILRLEEKVGTRSTESRAVLCRASTRGRLAPAAT